MNLGRGWGRRLAPAIAVACVVAVAPACKRGGKSADVNPIEPKISFNRTRVPLGSALEITYTWKLDPAAKKLGQDYRALVHVLDANGVVLFDDDHVPTPAPSTWEPGKEYKYQRTKFVPIYPYVGEAEVRMGLYAGRERVALKGEDAGLLEYKVAKIELLPQTENIFLVYKEGWYSPESTPENPNLERTWTKKDAVVQFKNPKKDIVVYLEADTNKQAFDQQPVLTVGVNSKAGVTVPIENSEVFLRKMRVKAADLGDGEWVDLKLSMNSAFVPKARGVHPTDDRELGVLVYHLYVVESDKVGSEVAVVDAQPLPATQTASTSTTPAAPAAPGKTPAAATGGSSAAPTAPASKASGKPGA